MQLWVQIHQLHLHAASLSLLGGKINHPSSRMRQFVEPQSNLGILFSPLKLCFFFCFCGLYFKTTRWIKKLCKETEKLDTQIKNDVRITDLQCVLKKFFLN